MNYVYVQSEKELYGYPGVWTVGFYQPDGTWEPESDHRDPEEAARRVAYLNGETGAIERPVEVTYKIPVDQWNRLRAEVTRIGERIDAIERANEETTGGR